jgi:hypothetical protein
VAAYQAVPGVIFPRRDHLCCGGWRCTSLCDPAAVDGFSPASLRRNARSGTRCGAAPLRRPAIIEHDGCSSRERGHTDFCTGRRDLAGRLKDLPLSVRSIAWKAQGCAPATVGSLPMGRRPLLRQRRLLGTIHGRALLAACVGNGDIPFAPLNPITALSLRCVVEFGIGHQPRHEGR